MSKAAKLAPIVDLVNALKWRPSGLFFSSLCDIDDSEEDIKVLEVEVNKKVMYSWGATHFGEYHIVTISLEELDNTSTIIEVNEEGFKENDDALSL